MIDSESNKVLEVIEFKPKTILPDLYSSEFVDFYLESLPKTREKYKKKLDKF